MKVQIYSPFIMINKTGLPFNLRAARSSRSTTRDVAVGDASKASIARYDLGTVNLCWFNSCHDQGHPFQSVLEAHC